MRCPTCGNDLKEGVKFCVKCGMPISTAAQPDNHSNISVISQALPQSNKTEKSTAASQTEAPSSAPIYLAADNILKYEYQNRVKSDGIVGLFNASVKLYFRNFKQIFGLSAIILIPFYVISYSIRMGYSGNNVRIINIFIYNILNLIFLPIITGLLTATISGIYLGNDVSTRKIFAATSKKIKALILTMTIIDIGASFLFSCMNHFRSLLTSYFFDIGVYSILVAFFIPIWIAKIPKFIFYAFTIFCPTLIIIENQNISGAFKKSYSLVSGYFIPVATTLFAASFAFIIQNNLTTYYYMETRNITNGAYMNPHPIISPIHVLISLLFFPFLNVAVTLLYYKRISDLV